MDVYRVLVEGGNIVASLKEKFRAESLLAINVFIKVVCREESDRDGEERLTKAIHILIREELAVGIHVSEIITKELFNIRVLMENLETLGNLVRAVLDLGAGMGGAGVSDAEKRFGPT